MVISRLVVGLVWKKCPMVNAMPSTPFQGFMATQVKRYSRATALMDKAEQANTNIRKEMIRIHIFCFFMAVNISISAKVGKFYHPV